MTQANDNRDVSQLPKFLTEASTSVNGKYCFIDMNQLSIDDDIDDDCVVVKKDKNLLSSGKNRKNPVSVDGVVYYDFDGDDQVKRRNVFGRISVFEIGESSGAKNNVTNYDDIIIEKDGFTFLCEICADSKPKIECFTIKGCSHSYSSDCVRSYVALKLEDGVSRVSCPVPYCEGVLEPEYCREILPVEVFERWGNLLCVSVIIASQKFYCPFKDCSALLIDYGVETVTQADCSSCFRLFCAQCKVGWHDGIECSEFQKLNENERQKEDIMLRNLAKTRKSRTCPVCTYYVERSEGCLHLICRCGTNNVTNDNIPNEIDDSSVEELAFVCQICADSKPKIECFTIKGCSHSYCYECVRNYVDSKLDDGVSRVSCPVPNCEGVLEPEYCREILPVEVFERWGKVLCESVILASQKFYCPFKDCSALLIDDGGASVTQAECPSCFRLFCAQCKVGWHDGIVCAEFQKLNENERQKEDIMLRNLAMTKKWQRCPACKYYVEKSQGCLYMKCRCGIVFFYSCGGINTDHTGHHCKKCG